ncbi:MAG: hypothetical protein E5W55_35680, partial [Mesorhizobium sp.]
YTEALLSAVPKLDRTESSRIRLDGDIPSAANPPTGCVFHPAFHDVQLGTASFGSRRARNDSVPWRPLWERSLY